MRTRRPGGPFLAGALLLTACPEPPVEGSQESPHLAAPSPDLASPPAARPWESTLWRRFVVEGPGPDRLPDFSRAGYHQGDAPIPVEHARVVEAARFGAVPDDGRDDTLAIQAALDEAGQAGGGLVRLPAGRLDVHTTRLGPSVVIRHSRVVLRGAGSGPGGTLLFLGAPAPYDPKRPLPRPGSSEGDARRVMAVSIIGSAAGEPLGAYMAPLRQGEDTVWIDNPAGLRGGELVRVLLSSQDVTAVPDLPTLLTAPFRLRKELSVTRGAHGQSISWLVQVDQVLDDGRVRLAQPARFDHLLEHGPRLERFPGIAEVGVEHLRIASAWPGGYSHHRPFPWSAADRDAIRSTTEQDYLWGAIWVSHAWNGWIRDVVIVDCTQGVRMQHVAHFTIEGVRHEGHDGHHGIHLARSHGVLVRAYEARARLVHPLSVESWSSGNVFLRARCSYGGYDGATATGPFIDFHGLFPYENLYDGVTGCYVKPGGDREVMPNAGVRNTFWNLELPARMDFRAEVYGDGELLRPPALDLTSGGSAATAHEHLPQSFVVGVHREGGLPVRVGGGGDRADRWLTVEGAGRAGVQPPSLYEAQWALRRRR